MTAIYILFIFGGTMIESASLLTAGLFNATARDYTPEEKAGCFQGIRIIIFVMLPMIIASLVCPAVIKGFGPVVNEFGVSPGKGYIAIPEGVGYLLPYTDSNGTLVESHVYPFELFLFSAIVSLLTFIPTYFVHKENKKFRQQKLAELNADIDVKDEKDDKVVVDETLVEQDVVADGVTVEKEGDSSEE